MLTKEFKGILRNLQVTSKFFKSLGYIISKGGITTNTLLVKGLKLDTVDLKGQILPGMSVVCSHEDNSIPIPIITFPGNLGDEKTLLNVWLLMEGYEI